MKVFWTVFGITFAGLMLLSTVGMVAYAWLAKEPAPAVQSGTWTATDANGDPLPECPTDGSIPKFSCITVVYK